MARILIIKTGALGDVLRTTSILPGLHQKYEPCEVTWVTAPAAQDLVVHHPLVQEVVTLDSKDSAQLASCSQQLAEQHFDLVLSLDDEEPLCQLASAMKCVALSGAYIQDGARAYSDDVEPWFGMGLLARDGKDAADRRKVNNQRSHPEIYADMLGIEQGQTLLPIPDTVITETSQWFADWNLPEDGQIIGLNTGASGRWRSKALPEPRVVELMQALQETLPPPLSFLILGGPEERERNNRIVDLAHTANLTNVIDAGTQHSLLQFAAIIGRCDLLVSSDSLALHIATALQRPIVAFFAPTSAAEIELDGLGEKVISTAPDYCSYAPDADNSSITTERLTHAAARVLNATNSPRNRA